MGNDLSAEELEALLTLCQQSMEPNPSLSTKDATLEKLLGDMMTPKGPKEGEAPQKRSLLRRTSFWLILMAASALSIGTALGFFWGQSVKTHQEERQAYLEAEEHLSQLVKELEIIYRALYPPTSPTEVIEPLPEKAPGPETLAPKAVA